MSEYVPIPLASLSKEALTGIIQSFIDQEGTDYGHKDFSSEEKHKAVKAQLDSGKAFVVFDPASESVSILSKDQYEKLSVERPQ